jgi:predicted DNA-binding transcriptional regulator AlpA
MDEKIVDVKKFCDIMGGIHIASAYKMAKNGMLPCVRIGRRLFFKESDIQKFIKSRVKNA